MANNDWDNHLRHLLEDYTPGDSTNPEGNAPPLHAKEETPDAGLQQQGWKRIEASLDAADHAFDETLKHKVNQYHPPYTEDAWNVFFQKWSERKYLRTKLILLKMAESAAILLLLFTAIQLGRSGKFFAPTTNDTENLVYLDNSIPKGSQGPSVFQTPESKKPALDKPTAKAAVQSRQIISQRGRMNSGVRMIPDGGVTHHTRQSAKSSPLSQDLPDSPALPDESSPLIAEAVATALPLSALEEDVMYKETSTVQSPELALTDEPSINTANINSQTLTDLRDMVSPADQLATHVSPVPTTEVDIFPQAKKIRPIRTAYTEFGLMAIADYNALRMPEDKLYSAGRQIVFPEKGIMSPGFGGGMTFSFNHPTWAIETGITYSSKTFKPGRQLIIGGAFDNGRVDFETMHIQVASLPVQYRYRFDHQGRFRTYGIAGMGLHVIAKSDIDVGIEYSFPSLSFGSDPNTIPNLAETINETRRISEHIRDGAPFSTKSFVSLHGGVGFEYTMAGRQTFFMQAIAQYQLPNISFSNNNGKHLRTVSLQTGVRTPLLRH